MTKDEVIKQALEALEKLYSAVIDAQSGIIDIVDMDECKAYNSCAAIQACRTALAEPKNTPDMHDLHRYAFAYRNAHSVDASNAFNALEEFVSKLCIAAGDKWCDKWSEQCNKNQKLINRLKLAEQDSEPLAEAWDEGYRQGVADERTSEANIGIAGFGMKGEPARVNPYRVDDPQPAPAVQSCRRFRFDYLHEYAAKNRLDYNELCAIVRKSLLPAAPQAPAVQSLTTEQMQTVLRQSIGYFGEREEFAARAVIAEFCRINGIAAPEAPAVQPAPSQYGSPELQALILASAIEKAAQPTPAVQPLTVPQTIRSELRQALAWGMTYGSIIPSHQWNEMRDVQVEAAMMRIAAAPQPAPESQPLTGERFEEWWKQKAADYGIKETK